jgi:hypothetical protein
VNLTRGQVDMVNNYFEVVIKMLRVHEGPQKFRSKGITSAGSKPQECYRSERICFEYKLGLYFFTQYILHIYHL